MLACWSDRIVQNSCSGLASFRKQVDLRYLSPNSQCWTCLPAFCLTWEEKSGFFLCSVIHQAPLLYIMTCLELPQSWWIWVVQPINGQNCDSLLFVYIWLWCMMKRKIFICVLGGINSHTKKRLWFLLNTGNQCTMVHFRRFRNSCWCQKSLSVIWMIQVNWQDRIADDT